MNQLIERLPTMDQTPIFFSFQGLFYMNPKYSELPSVLSDGIDQFLIDALTQKNLRGYCTLIHR